eukprot:gene8318-864_t
MLNFRVLSGLAVSVAFAFKGQYMTAIILSAATIVLHIWLKPSYDSSISKTSRKPRRDDVRAILASVPHITEKRAKSTLAMCNNDVTAAIAMLEKTEPSLHGLFIEKKEAMYAEGRRRFTEKYGARI